jgi:trans-2,3-dihydro-3-hydroxyanthranilate isomerase
MNRLPYVVYDAFTHIAFGGSPAAIVMDADKLNDQQRHNIARELGIPATAFVEHINNNDVQVRFRSPTTEYPMCGHGTICLISHLINQNLIIPTLQDSQNYQVKLKLPSIDATVEVSQQPNQKAEVWLDIQPAKLTTISVNMESLGRSLGLNPDSFHATMPIKRADSDFRHLIVALADLESIQTIKPDFSLMTELSDQMGIDTIIAFCSETIDPIKNLHVRDFCPAVGSPESAATGTSNASLCTYLVEQGLFLTQGLNQNTDVLIEQGYEMGRPSLVKARLTFFANQLSRIQIGGVASRVFEGFISIP